jgi:hypothetical protein
VVAVEQASVLTAQLFPGTTQVVAAAGQVVHQIS